MQDETPLHVTAFSGAIRCMEELISRGTDVKPVSKASSHTNLSLLYKGLYYIFIFTSAQC
jgi:hypothetical protein